MKKMFHLIAFDCEGTKVTRTLYTYKQCEDFAKRHGLEIFSINEKYYSEKRG